MVSSKLTVEGSTPPSPGWYRVSETGYLNGPPDPRRRLRLSFIQNFSRFNLNWDLIWFELPALLFHKTSSEFSPCRVPYQELLQYKSVSFSFFLNGVGAWRSSSCRFGSLLPWLYSFGYSLLIVLAYLLFVILLLFPVVELFCFFSSSYDFFLPPQNP